MNKSALSAAAFLLAAAGAHATPPAGQDALAGAQVKVDVGGRKLNMYCTGRGSPTVLFEADGGRAGWDWSAVLPEVAKRTRACVYDRAGMGASDPAIRASTVANASKDLNFLIKNARMDAPFVLVGAGYGAMVAQHHALRSRGAVTGLVLVEAMHEDALPADRAARLDAALACLAAAEDGKTVAACAYPATATNGEVGPRLAAAQAAQVAPPSYWRARASELDSLETSANQMRAARKPFGDMPLAEVAHGEPAAVVAAVMEVLDKQK
ncbi:alpha/beta hydrolase [Duganella sp. BJB488]|uniref:alpha/beta fold hydrolase n=1 Tax=unclassified Duganella TaxID=2636909 RepID=UPI000E340D1B|nr:MULTISPECIES: alpha/beta hydrolase [unclassified Duganella]RFP15260.1 alpha/beta hydrolase [Duganella sp. BJB489]RFP19816.1 alpha/beta hydrolase [Duganella sp. BJB488]RFP38203.1 alpha/beta hydrolase [Duganella sp. BJB480]